MKTFFSSLAVLMMLALMATPVAFGQSDNANGGADVSRSGEKLDMTGWTWGLSCGKTVQVIEGNYTWSSVTRLTPSWKYKTSFNIKALGKVVDLANGSIYNFSFSSDFEYGTSLTNTSPTRHKQYSLVHLTKGEPGSDDDMYFLFSTMFIIDTNGNVTAEHSRNVTNCPA